MRNICLVCGRKFRTAVGHQTCPDHRQQEEQAVRDRRTANHKAGCHAAVADPSCPICRQARPIQGELDL